MTGIEWTDTTWNPTSGCDRVSPGCDNCYALTMAKRLKAMGQAGYQNDGDPRTSGPGFALTMHPDRLDLPLKWRKPRKVFVNSMSDLFHKDVTDEFIARVFAVMALASQHQFQLLTKRHARMKSLLTSDAFTAEVADAAHLICFGEDANADGRGRGEAARRKWDRVSGVSALPWPLPNVWLGVSVENQQWADIRIPALLDVPAALRWISAEPLLGPVDLDRDGWLLTLQRDPFGDPLWGNGGLDWVVAGGESGPGARPMHPAWVRSLRDQCDAAGVPYLYKQWGAWAPRSTYATDDRHHVVMLDGTDRGTPWAGWGRDQPDAVVMERVGKARAGRLLDGVEHNGYPVEQVTS